MPRMSVAMKDPDNNDRRGAKHGRASRRDESPALDTKVAHRVLLDGLDQIRGLLETASLPTKTEIGSVLWEVDEALAQLLDTVKDALRSEAVRELDGRVGTHTFLGEDLGEAAVLIPQPVLRVPKGKNMDDVRRGLGSQFSMFFDEITTYTPRKEFEERVVALNDQATQQILLDAVERVELTPRVSFKRNRPPRSSATE